MNVISETTLGSFSNLGTGGLMNTARAYAACTYDSAKMFISGGNDGTLGTPPYVNGGPVTNDVQFSLQ
jgi:hypothetical protein